jgi:hypothetical protein
MDLPDVDPEVLGGTETGTVTVRRHGEWRENGKKKRGSCYLQSSRGLLGNCQLLQPLMALYSAQMI